MLVSFDICFFCLSIYRSIRSSGFCEIISSLWYLDWIPHSGIWLKFISVFLFSVLILKVVSTISIKHDAFFVFKQSILLPLVLPWGLGFRYCASCLSRTVGALKQVVSAFRTQISLLSHSRINITLWSTDRSRGHSFGCQHAFGITSSLEHIPFPAKLTLQLSDGGCILQLMCHKYEGQPCPWAMYLSQPVQCAANSFLTAW